MEKYWYLAIVQFMDQNDPQINNYYIYQYEYGHSFLANRADNSRDYYLSIGDGKSWFLCGRQRVWGLKKLAHRLDLLGQLLSQKKFSEDKEVNQINHQA